MLVGKVSSVNFMAEQNSISFANINSSDTMQASLKALVADKPITLEIKKENANNYHPDCDVFEIRATRKIAGVKVPSKSIFRMPLNASENEVLAKIVSSLNGKLFPMLESKCSTLLSAIQKSAPKFQR